MGGYYRSKGGLTPFTGMFFLLMIVVAITFSITTYAWILSYSNSPIQHETALTVENVRFYEDETDDFVEVVLKNSGLDAIIVDKIYAGTSPSNLMAMNMENCNPQTQRITQGSTQNITIKCCCEEQNKCYFTIATKSGETVQFSVMSTTKNS